MNPLLYSTYSTKRIGLVGNPQQRATSNTKDQRFINCFPELVKGGLDRSGDFNLIQRPGLVLAFPTAAGVGRGVYYYNTSVYSVVGNQLYRNTVAIQTLSTSTGNVGFQEFSTGIVKYLIVLDGLSGWVINSAGTVTKINSPNFPSPHIPQAAYLDGYLFVAKAQTDDIYNCVLLDPFTWNAGDYTTAEMFPDNIVALCRQNNYVVAIGTNTTEYFYDAGVFPGTPLQRNAAALHQIGSPAPYSMVQIEEQVMFIGQTSTGGRSVWVFTGFQPDDISIEPVRRSLDAEGVNIFNAKAFCVRSKGHRFYVLNLTNKTWVYDFDEKMWHEWADSTGTARFPCDYACDYPTGSPAVQDRTKGYIYTLDGTVSTDATAPDQVNNITSSATTMRNDFGTLNRKWIHRLSLVADISSTPGAYFTLQWSDDDYNTWSAPRNLAVTNMMPSTTQLGSFRRRAFRLTYSQPTPCRIEGIEVDINTGIQ